ncbi:hypothetical protein [Roseinatronobacter sp. NSM]|uniref:hypothetical protein n=1 Tax=Roseinatronobacter sp. NSM TaxID=3457785 RepID=UPI004035F51E
MATYRFERKVRGSFALVLVLGVAGCATGPDMPARPPQAGGPAPALLPITEVLRQTEDGPNATLLTATAPDDRANALRARAARLRGPVIAGPQGESMRAAGAALR